MKKNLTSCKSLAEQSGLSVSHGMEAVIKAQLIAGIIAAVEESGITHVELAKRSRLPRTAVTGILSGSLQKITIDRVLKLVEAVGLVAEIKLKKAA
ncbi:MAG: XRE family transcriptional regulator [Bdellovibrio sp.]|nr:XRE family transcriptional regulator [Bdellovibrio sp.]